MSASRGDREESSTRDVAPVVLPRGTVFVVEDEDGVRDSITGVLEQKGYLVHTARDGVEALSRLISFRGRAVLLLDLSMPRMDGVAFLAELARHDVLSRLSIVVVSGRRRLPSLPHQVMRKPFTSQQLIAVVEQCFDALGFTN